MHISPPLTRKPPPQNHRRRRAIDVFLPDTSLALATRALRFERRARLERRPALIDHVHGKTKAALELSREATRSRRERSRTTVRIIRRSDHEQARTQHAYFARDGVPVRP